MMMRAIRPSFRRRCVFSIDHEVIGIQYALTALVFLLAGLILMLLSAFFQTTTIRGTPRPSNGR